VLVTALPERFILDVVKKLTTVFLDSLGNAHISDNKRQLVWRGTKEFQSKSLFPNGDFEFAVWHSADTQPVCKAAKALNKPLSAAIRDGPDDRKAATLFALWEHLDACATTVCTCVCAELKEAASATFLG
jgi:hypothetical protein